MTAVATNTNHPIAGEAIEALRAAVRGAVVTPDDPGYDAARTVYNAMIDKKPALVVQAVDVADVIAGVKLAGEQDLPICVRGGGHNVAGNAVNDGGMVIDLSLMRGVRVDPSQRTVRVAGGATWGDVDRETQLQGLAAPLGFVSTTGIAGLTLGGGFGYLARRFGWTCDSVVAFDVVTADARIVRATETEHPDLFWAPRGGGGNFGVVTGFTYRLAPVGPEILGGAIAWRAEEAPRILEAFRTLGEESPPELSVAAGLRKAPPVAWLPEAVHGQDIVALFICYTGPADEGERLLAPIKKLGRPVADMVMRRPYLTQQCLLDATQPKGRRYYWKSEFLPGHERELLDRARWHAERLASPHSLVIFFPLLGAIEQLPRLAELLTRRQHETRRPLESTAAPDLGHQVAFEQEGCRLLHRAVVRSACSRSSGCTSQERRRHMRRAAPSVRR